MALTNTIFHTQKSRMKTVNHKYMSLAWTLQIPTCFICCICHAFASAFKKHMFTHFLGTYAVQRSPRYDMSRGKLPLLANKATWSHWSIDWCCWNLANSFIINQWLDLRGSIWWEHSFIASNLDSWILIVNTNPTSSPSHVQQSPSACPRRCFFSCSLITPPLTSPPCDGAALTQTPVAFEGSWLADTSEGCHTNHCGISSQKWYHKLGPHYKHPLGAQREQKFVCYLNIN